MRYQIFELLTFFVIYSFAGWVMESIFRSLCERKIINTGFLKGPYCPIYGIGAIIIFIFLDGFKDNIILLFIMGVIVLTIWEYVVGVLLEKVFNTKYWDYSDHKFNFQGRICLINSIYWGILGIAFVKYINPFVIEKLHYIDIRYLKIIIYTSSIIMLIDAISTIVKFKNLKLTLEKIEKLNIQLKEKLEEFRELSKNKSKNDMTENIQKMIDNIEIKKNRILRKLYKNVYRLKKAFPTIDSKEITDILNKRIEIVKKNKKVEIIDKKDQKNK